MVENISTLLSVATPLAFMLGLWVMAQISRRFGEVTHRPPLYRYFYIAMVLAAFPVFVRLLDIGLSERELATRSGHSIDVLLHDIPLALSVSLSAVIAWRYWGWLIYSHDGNITPPTRN